MSMKLRLAITSVGLSLFLINGSAYADARCNLQHPKQCAKQAVKELGNGLKVVGSAVTRAAGPAVRGAGSPGTKMTYGEGNAGAKATAAVVKPTISEMLENYRVLIEHPGEPTYESGPSPRPLGCGPAAADRCSDPSENPANDLPLPEELPRTPEPVMD